MKQKQVDNSIPWVYDGYNVPTEVQPPEWATGYVYLIKHRIPVDEGRGGEISKIYIGKKQLQSVRRKRIGIREKANTGTRKTFKLESKDSGWQEYWGSSNSLKIARAEGIGTWERHILYWCYSKKNATYLELRTQMEMRVLEQESYNDNINGSIYRHDTSKKLWEEHKEKMKAIVRKPRIKKQIPY